MKTPGIQIFTCVCSCNDSFGKFLFFILISQLSSGILVGVE